MTITLRNKFLLLACLKALLISLSIGVLSYYRITQITLDTAIDGLVGETRLMAVRLQRGYDEVRNDTHIVSRTPPIKGIMRSLSNDDIDPKDGSTTELWRTRLATIFTSIMHESPHYTQMRYIGLNNNGKEIVRVNRTANGLVTTPEHQLQQKIHEPYTQAILNGQESFFFSKVTLNREHGKVEQSSLPTIRAVNPVTDENNNIFGMIVINVDFAAMQNQMFHVVKPQKKAYLLNQSGDYVEYTPQTDQTTLEFNETRTKLPPTFLKKILSAIQNESVFTEGDDIISYVRMHIDKSTSEEFVGAVLRIPQDELLKDAYTTRRDMALLSIFLIFVAILITTIVTRWFTRPLKNMTHTISTRGNDHNLDLPVDSQDEIGELARAFKEMTDELIESETKIRITYENIIDGILTFNDNGIIESCNPACEKIFGYSYSELVGKPITLLIPQNTHLENQIHSTQHSNDKPAHINSFDTEVTGICKDGTSIPLEIGLNTAIGIGGSTQVIAIIRDITERHKAERERENLIASLKRSNEELDNFAYITSHDLKEPLRAIHNHCNFLMQDYEDILEEDGKKRIKRLMTLAKRMEKLINDLLYFSRLGREEVAIKKTDLNKVIEDIKDTHHDLFEENNVIIEIPRKLPTIICNEIRITELFRNLITNAVKYNECDTKKIEIGCDKKGTFYVKDNGIGIDQKFFNDVFRIFKQLHRREKYGSGTGSGLTFVKKIVERHGGKIWLESEPNQGTTFYFTLKGDNNDTK